MKGYIVEIVFTVSENLFFTRYTRMSRIKKREWFYGVFRKKWEIFDGRVLEVEITKIFFWKYVFSELYGDKEMIKIPFLP